jgi:hypothetical protein
VTTIFKVEKKQHFMEATNAAGTIQAAFAYTHPLAKMFAEGKEVLFAECSVQGKFVDVKKLVTEKDFNRNKQRKEK